MSLRIDRLLADGLAAFPPSQLEDLVGELEIRARTTGLVAPLLVASAIRQISDRLKELDGEGGPAKTMVEALDAAIRVRIPEIANGDPLNAANAAFLLRDDVDSIIRPSYGNR